MSIKTAKAVSGAPASIPGVKHVIAVASGKGGVGKSTTTVNLAVSLQRAGARVGILDADIYGPNIPQLLGAHEHPKSSDGKTLLPVEAHGLQTMSIGYLIDQDDQPMIWRGPMATGALQQLLRDTQWDNLDYLFIDLPPGTGDIQLTMSQKIPVTGGVIVTTPQDIALLDVKKGLKMFERVKIPVLGILENMAGHICSKCGHLDHVFGQGGGAHVANEYNVDLLGSVPLDRRIREQSDHGLPITLADGESEISQAYATAATCLSEKIDRQARSGGVKFPKIVVETS